MIQELRMTVNIMGEKITRASLFITICNLLSLRSICQRGKVGCVITTVDHRIISTGYNGPLQSTCKGRCDVEHKCLDAIHAEANAITFAAKEGIALRGATLYCTHAPCYECAKLILQAGITQVVYQMAYRESKGVELLLEQGLTVNSYTDEQI